MGGSGLRVLGCGESGASMSFLVFDARGSGLMGQVLLPLQIMTKAAMRTRTPATLTAAAIISSLLDSSDDDEAVGGDEGGQGAGAGHGGGAGHREGGKGGSGEGSVGGKAIVGG